MSLRLTTPPQRIAGALIAGFFLLLFSFRTIDVYHQHFFDHGALVTAWQAMRIASIPYLLWLQYTVGGYVLWRMKSPVAGLSRVITACLLGTALWHLLLFALGLAGLYYYPVMLLLAGGVMLGSWRHLAALIGQCDTGGWYRLGGGEKLLVLLVVLAMAAFIFLKGTYPSGAHDFFNHYFTYYKEVVDSGNLGPHASWYQYFYSKGLGLFFMSMILLDPLAIHPAASTLVFMAALMMFDLLRKPGASLALPLLGVFLYFTLYVYTPGRGLFALNGGWGDLEKTHELSAVLIFGCVWLTMKALQTGERVFVVTLHVVNAALVVVSFGALAVPGMFYALLVACGLLTRNLRQVRLALFAGMSLGAAAVVVMLVNYLATGIPQDQFASTFRRIIDWEKVIRLGYSLELYSHLNDIEHYWGNTLPLVKSTPKIVVEFFRLYMLWPLLLMGAVLAIMGRPAEIAADRTMRVTAVFLLASLLVALFLGGRAVPVSFFRLSSFNYAPVLLFCLLFWQCGRPPVQRTAIILVLLLLLPWTLWQAPQALPGWKKLAHSAFALASGNYSVRDAIGDQRGRAGRLKGGGIYPAMEEIYAGLPPGTRVWSMHNHSYCLLPACNVGQYFSQVTSPRWYEIALGSIEDGKKIMQEEGLNFIFYSRSVPVVGAADAKDQLAGFYKGLAPEHIADVYGILWTNGWDYLLTWKEQSVAPLDAEFMDSWRLFQKNFVAPRRAQLPVEVLAAIVQRAVRERDFTHMYLQEEPTDEH